MSCTERVTCSNCNGEGKYTVYTEPAYYAKFEKWSGNDNYERPTKTVTCSKCNGSGKEKIECHDYVPAGWTKMGGGENFRCRRCGKTYMVWYGN